MSLAALERRLRTLEARRPARSAPASAIELAGQLGFVLDPYQERVLASSSPRLLLNWARQTGKTAMTALLALATMLGQPGSLVLVLSPGLRQSTLLFRQLLRFYHELREPVPAAVVNRLSLELVNGSAVFALPGSESRCVATAVSICCCSMRRRASRTR